MKSVVAPAFTHCVDFGPGVPSASANLTAANKLGSGLHVVAATRPSLKYQQKATGAVIFTFQDFLRASDGGAFETPAVDWVRCTPRP